jgi:hypothetical protein
LALGAALRDKIFNLTQSQKVVCESLAVFKNGDPHRPAAVLGAERLMGGPGADLINVDQVHTKYLSADRIVYGGRPLNPAAAGAVTPAQLLQWLQSMGLLREQAVKPKPEAGAPTNGDAAP